MKLRFNNFRQRSFAIFIMLGLLSMQGLAQMAGVKNAVSEAGSLSRIEMEQGFSYINEKKIKTGRWNHAGLGIQI